MEWWIHLKAWNRIGATSAFSDAALTVDEVTELVKDQIIQHFIGYDMKFLFYSKCDENVRVFQEGDRCDLIYVWKRSVFVGWMQDTLYSVVLEQGDKLGDYFRNPG